MRAPKILCHGSDPALEATLRRAATGIWPGSSVQAADHPDREPDDAIRLLLGGAAEPADEPGTLAFRQTLRLPAGTDEATARELLRTAAECLALRRENESLRGNLRTVGRRMAHDLRTPLGSVLTLSQLLQEIIPQGNTDAQGFIASVLRSAEKLRELIDKMSYFTRTAVEPLEMARVPLAEIVQTAQGRVAPLSMNRKARIVAAETWPHVQGNVAGLEMVWRNLLTNALQHSGENPRLELGWREESDTRIRCFVRDPGPGLGAQGFVPFERLHEITAARGLGLPLVERIVAQHGGTCRHETLPTGGNEVSFTLRKATA